MAKVKQTARKKHLVTADQLILRRLREQKGTDEAKTARVEELLESLREKEQEILELERSLGTARSKLNESRAELYAMGVFDINNASAASVVAEAAAAAAGAGAGAGADAGTANVFVPGTPTSDDYIPPTPARQSRSRSRSPVRQRRPSRSRSPR